MTCDYETSASGAGMLTDSPIVTQHAWSKLSVSEMLVAPAKMA